MMMISIGIIDESSFNFTFISFVLIIINFVHSTISCVIQDQLCFEIRPIYINNIIQGNFLNHNFLVFGMPKLLTNSTRIKRYIIVLTCTCLSKLIQSDYLDNTHMIKFEPFQQVVRLDRWWELHVELKLAQ